jgi:peptidoglycan biosynthesis protein MviN/MurJ (putative lipid II flippase)
MYISGILNLHGKFKASAVGPLLNKILFVLIAVVLYPLIGISAYSLGAIVMTLFLIKEKNIINSVV